MMQQANNQHMQQYSLGSTPDASPTPPQQHWEGHALLESSDYHSTPQIIDPRPVGIQTIDVM